MKSRVRVVGAGGTITPPVALHTACRFCVSAAVPPRHGRPRYAQTLRRDSGDAHLYATRLTRKCGASARRPEVDTPLQGGSAAYISGVGAMPHHKLRSMTHPRRICGQRRYRPRLLKTTRASRRVEERSVAKYRQSAFPGDSITVSVCRIYGTIKEFSLPFLMVLLGTLTVRRIIGTKIPVVLDPSVRRGRRSSQMARTRHVAHGAAALTTSRARPRAPSRGLVTRSQGPHDQIDGWRRLCHHAAPRLYAHPDTEFPIP